MAGGDKWYSDSPVLFNDDNQTFQASFNPETISALAELEKNIPFEQMRGVYFSVTLKSELETLAEYSNPYAVDSFEGCFLPYLRGWVEFLKSLDGTGKGVLFYIG